MWTHLIRWGQGVIWRPSKASLIVTSIKNWNDSLESIISLNWPLANTTTCTVRVDAFYWFLWQTQRSILLKSRVTSLRQMWIEFWGEKHLQRSELLKGDIFKNRYHFLSVIHTYITFHQLYAMTFPVYVFLLPPLTWLHVLRLESHWEKKSDFVVIYLIIYLFIFLSVAVNNNFNKSVAYILSDAKEKRCLQSGEEHLCCEHILTLHCYRQEESHEESKFNGLNQIYWIKFKSVSLA